MKGKTRKRQEGKEKEINEAIILSFDELNE